MDPFKHADINNHGEPGSLQRMCYLGARASSTPEWDNLQAVINHCMDKLHADDKSDTELSLLLNAYGGAVEEVRRLRSLMAGAARMLDTKGKP